MNSWVKQRRVGWRRMRMRRHMDCVPKGICAEEKLILRWHLLASHNGMRWHFIKEVHLSKTPYQKHLFYCGHPKVKEGEG
jgi:hypothetical protein